MDHTQIPNVDRRRPVGRAQGKVARSLDELIAAAEARRRSSTASVNARSIDAKVAAVKRMVSQR
jgi:hypothetical protein